MNNSQNAVVKNKPRRVSLPGLHQIIEAPRGRAGEESDSVKDFLIALFAYPAAEPTGNALTGIQVVWGSSSSL